MKPLTSRPLLSRSAKVLLCLLFLSFPIQSLAKITFEKTYGGPGENRAFCVVQTPDGGYAVTGMRDSQIGLFRTDSLGAIVVDSTYGGFQGRSLEFTANGGFVIVGSTSILGSWDVCVIETDSFGKVLNEKIYGSDANDFASSIQCTQDGGYIIAGDTDYDIFLMKTDFLLDSLWGSTYGGTEGQSVHQTPDFGFIVAGEIDTGSAFERDIYLVKTDSLGTLEWTQTYGPAGQDAAYSVDVTLDGGYIVGGLSQSLVTGWAFLMKTDSMGESLWVKGCGGLYVRDVHQTNDGGYVAAAWSGAFFAKTDSFGDTIWTRDYRGSPWAAALSVDPTSDGGYIVAGYTTESGSKEQLLLIKTDENGLVERDGGVVSIERPPDTVFADSTYPVVATVESFRPSFVNCDVIATIGSYCDTVPVSILGPDSSAQVTFANWEVPAADSTMYTMTVCTRLVDDVDTTNDCMQKSIFAYKPVKVAEKNQDFVIQRLLESVPNPFSRSTVISYSLPDRGHVSLTVCDIAGRQVETIVHEEQAPGLHQIHWNTGDHTSGIYFFRLEVQDVLDVKKIVLLK